MTQDERNEEAAIAIEYESMRAQGISMADIGAGKVKTQKFDGEITAQHIDDIESGEEKTATTPTEKV